MLDYVLKLNSRPNEIDARDIETLRGAGFDDRGVLDIVMVVALFNFMNRLADGLGVETTESHLKSRQRGERRVREALAPSGSASADAGE